MQIIMQQYVAQISGGQFSDPEFWRLYKKPPYIPPMSDKPRSVLEKPMEYRPVYKQIPPDKGKWNVEFMLG